MNGSGWKFAVALFVVWAAICASAVVAAVFVIVHFVAKYW